MGKFVQIVIGPAGAGKSSFCRTMQEHGQAMRRKVHVGNLDPAADNFGYEPSFDIRDLITIEEVMKEEGFGPNGGLVFCMEHLLQNSDWLREELEECGEDQYILLDCPGQIELYSHLPIMRDVAKLITSWGYRAVCVYILDALFVLEPAKFVSGCMLSLSCMVQLELPYIGVISKCDIADKEMIENMLEYEGSSGILSNDVVSSGPLKKLTEAIGSIIDDYMMVSFVMLDVSDEESMDNVMTRIDMLCQYGEDLEPHEPRDDYGDGDGNGNGNGDH